MKCATPSCENDVVTARLCRNCYAGAYYWSKKGVAAQQHRKHQLRILGERLDDLRPAYKNVLPFRKRRAA